MTTVTSRRLSRSAGHGVAARPVRIVHLGLGSFFRAHQAWYTDRASDAGPWGIAAFTGRRPGLARDLAGQGGLYTLVTRAGDGDRFEVVNSLSAAHAASDHAAWLGYFRSPDLAVVTSTVTEAGYLRSSHGIKADDPAVRADVEALRRNLTARVETAPGRLLAGLVARNVAGLGRIAVVPCDNLPGNGAVVADVVCDLARLVDPALVPVVRDAASFVTTMVDRITPETTDADRHLVQARTGLFDTAPVTTEPFSEWVVSGGFPSGRPAWETSGVTITHDVTPFALRKLWLLNGGHSLLAYGASIRGHATVADAVCDPECRRWLEEWWDDASRHLPLPAEDIGHYRAELLARFENPRIHHRLAQIAADGSQKIPVRILPALRAELSAGRTPVGATRALAVWICHLRGLGAPLNDSRASAFVAAATGSASGRAVTGVLSLLEPSLAEDRDLVESVRHHVEELGGR